MLGTSKSVFGFDPRSVGGCALWLDGADSRATSNITTGTWYDKSTYGSNATSNAGGSAFTMGTINGVPAVTFPAASSAAFIAQAPITLSSSGGFSIFFVARWTAAGAANSRFFSTQWSVGGTLDIELYPTTANTIPSGGTLYGGTTSAGASLTGVTLSSNTPFVYSTVFTSTATNGYSHWLNGVTGGTQTPAGAGTVNGMVIGNYSNPSSANAFVGQMGEFIVYNAALTTGQRQAVEGYLSWKWGLETLATTSLPTSISSCVLWLDGADSTRTTNIATGVWLDKSGLGSNTTSNAGSSAFSMGTLNGLPAVTFPAASVSALRANTTLTSATGFSAFFIASVTTNNSTSTFLEGNTGAPFRIAAIGSLPTPLQFSGSGLVSGGTVTLNQPFIGSVIVSSSSFAVWYNGMNTATTTPSTITLSSMNIGNRATASSSVSFTGRMGEVIIYNRSLSTSERQFIEAYLGRKWNVQVGTVVLPITHPFYSIQPFARYFNPIDVPGCGLWLDAADPSGTGTVPANGSLATWVDKSGNGRNYTTYVTAPIYSSTDGGGVTFNYGQTLYNADSWSGNGADVDIFVVSTPWPNTQYNDWRTLVRGAGHHVLIEYNSSRLGLYNGAFYQFGSLTLGNTKSLLYVTVNNVFVSSAAINGTSALSVAGGSQASWYQPFYWVGGLDQYQPWGTINELIIFSNVTTAQRQQIEGYLAWKWGLASSLPATGHSFSKFPASTAAQFNPVTVTGCQLWLDGADPGGNGGIPANGATVSMWKDKSGNGNNATGGVSPTYNTSQRAIAFNGSSWLTTPYSAVPTNETVFIVFQTTTTAVQANAFMIGPSTNGGRLIMSVNENDGFGLSFKIGAYFVANGSRLSQLQNTVYLGTTTVASTTSYVYLNGTQGPSSTLTYSGSGTTQIGTATSGTSPYIGYIYEILIYNTALTIAQRQAVEGYLAWKWGLQTNLPTTHPFYKFAPGAVGY